jgi:hypothetical protein
MANLFDIPEQHMINWGDALVSKDTPWSTTPEYHQWGTADLTKQKSKEIAQDYGNLAAGAFEMAASPLAFGASPMYDIPQAFHNYSRDPGKYEVNNKWDKINAYFPDLQGTTVSGILNAIDMEDPLSAAWNRGIGAAKPFRDRMRKGLTNVEKFGGKIYNYMHGPRMRFERQQLINRRKQDMQDTIRQAEAAEAAKQKAAADAAAAKQVRQNIQTYGNRDRPNEGINAPGGGKGQSPTGGDVAGTPFVRGGYVDKALGGRIRYL